MKRATDYTQEELLDIQQEELDTLIEVELMVEGITVETYPGPEPIFGQSIKKYTMYTFNSTPLFTSLEQAQKAADLVSFVASYESLNGIYSAQDEDIKIQMSERYLTSDLEAIKADKNKWEHVQREWSSLYNKYQKFCTQRKCTENYIFDLINKAWDDIGAMRERQAQYDKYLSLAGDATIATRFFIDMLKKQAFDPEFIAEEVKRVTHDDQ